MDSAMFQLRSFVHQRLYAAAEEILVEVEKTITLALNKAEVFRQKEEAGDPPQQPDRQQRSAGLDCVCECVTPPWLTVPASAIHGRAVMWHQLSLKRTPCSHFSIPLSSPLPASLPPEVRVEALLDMSRGTHPRFFWVIILNSSVIGHDVWQITLWQTATPVRGLCHVPHPFYAAEDTPVRPCSY